MTRQPCWSSLWRIRRAGWLALAMATAVVPATAETARFRLELGEPEIEIEIVGHQTVTSDAMGDVRLTLEVAPGDVLELRSRTQGFHLEHQVVVEADRLGATFRIDLRPFGRWLPQSEPLAPPPRVPRPPESGDLERPADPRSGRPCRDPAAPSCLRHWLELVRDRRCDAVSELDRVVRTANPGLSQPEPRLALAEAYLDCGLAARGETRRAWLEQAGALASAADEEPWCEEVPARLLAEIHDALGTLALAAEAASVASSRCRADRQALAVEWGVYFALRASRPEVASDLARRATGSQAVFLDTWIAASAGRCASGWRALRALELPCAALPQELCAESVARMLVVCGTEREDFLAAAQRIEEVVAQGAGKALGKAWVTERPDLARLLAEARFRGSRFAEAAGLFSRLAELVESDLRNDPSSDQADLANLAWRRADALFLAAEADLEDPSPETRKSLLWAYARAVELLPSGSIERAVSLNNLAVLRGRSELGDAAAAEELRGVVLELEEAVVALPESVVARELRFNLLALEWRLLSAAPTAMDGATSAGRLALARRLSARLAEADRGLGDPAVVMEHKGRWFALARALTDLEEN